MSESAALDVVSTEVVSGPPLRIAMRAEEAKAWVAAIDEVRRAILQPGSDYDVIPGTSKPSLFKPGAEKLLFAARLGFTMERVDDEQSRSMQGVTYKCTVHSLDNPEGVIAQCDGYAGYDEDRFYVSEADAIAKEKAYAAQYERAARQSKMVGYRAPWNSVAKMSQKRALVGATLNATATSGLFTQDLEDEPRGLWDPGQAVLPQIHLLTEDERKELTAWRKSEGLPGLGDLSAEQGVGVGVQIGMMLAARETARVIGQMQEMMDAQQAHAPQASEPAAEGQDDQAEQTADSERSDEPLAGSPGSSGIPGAANTPEAMQARLEAAVSAAVPDRAAEERTRVQRLNAMQVGRELTDLGYDPSSWPNLSDRRAALVEAILADEEEAEAMLAEDENLPEG